MVQTSHIKRYFTDLIQSDEIIWSTAKITFVPLVLIPSTFCGAFKSHFRTSVMRKVHSFEISFNYRIWSVPISLLKICLTSGKNQFSIDTADPVQ